MNPQKGEGFGSFGWSSINSILAFTSFKQDTKKGIAVCLDRPVLVVAVFSLFVICSFALYPFLGKAFFPRTDPEPVRGECEGTGWNSHRGNRRLRLQDGTRHSERGLAGDFNMIVSNIGITPDLSAIYTSNSGMHTAFIQVSLNEDHKIGSYAYMQKVREKLSADFPDVATYFQAGGLVDSMLTKESLLRSISRSEATTSSKPTTLRRRRPPI